MKHRKRPALRMAAAVVAVVAPLAAVTIPNMAAAGPVIIADGEYGNGETSDTFQGPASRADCGPGSRPEPGMQGRVPVEHRESGRSSEGYECNMEVVGHYSPDDPQGFEGAEWQFARYEHCAYYSQRLAAAGVPSFANGVPESQRQRLLETTVHERPGTIVLDVSDPQDPKFSENLTTPGMLDPWETLSVHKERGLLAAVNVLDGEGAGLFEVYDISEDCAHPKLLSSTVMESVINHEGNFAADGMTYYSGGLTPGIITAIDVSDPTNPERLAAFWAHMGTHGMSTSPDGNRLYLAHINDDWAYTLPTSGNGSTQSVTGGNGVGIYDVSEIQQRKPNPNVGLVSALEWNEDGQIGQQTLSIFKDDHPYIISIDEAGHGGARIIDMADEKDPTVVSKVKTEIMMPQNRDTAMSDVRRLPKENGGILFFGYNFHFCNVDKIQDPAMLACSGFNQGVRVFDIRDLSEPKEIAYFNPGGDGTLQSGSFGGTYSGYPAATPMFVPSRQELWFTDQDRGMYVVRFTNGSWISEATDVNASHGNNAIPG